MTQPTGEPPTGDYATFEDIVAKFVRPGARGWEEPRSRIEADIMIYRRQVRDLVDRSSPLSAVEAEWLSIRYEQLRTRVTLIAGLSQQERREALAALDRVRDPAARDRPVFTPRWWQRLARPLRNLFRTRSAAQLATARPGNTGPRTQQRPRPPRRVEARAGGADAPSETAVAVLALLDTLTDRAPREIADHGHSPTGAELHRHLDAGALTAPQTARARVVVDALVDAAERGIPISGSDPRALVVFEHRYALWVEAWPVLSQATAGADGRAAAREIDHTAATLASPRALTAAHSPPEHAAASDTPTAQGPDAAAGAAP